MVVLASFALAACGTEAPPLDLGDRIWSVGGGTWEAGTASVTFVDGFAFDVVDHGAPAGVVFVGTATHTTVDADGQLAPSLQRELGIPVAPGAWTVPVDVAWSTGDAALPDWLSLRLDGSTTVSVDLPDMETVLVVSRLDVDRARARARRAIRDRALALSDAGYPLTSMLTSHPASWRLVEARTFLPVGALAGAWTGTADPWLSTFHDDPILDGGRRVATVALGTRYTEALSGT